MLQVGVASLLLVLVLDVVKEFLGSSVPLWDQIDGIVLFVSSSTAPLNYGIFGPSPVFTGKMKTGGVTIKPVESVALPVL